MKLAAKLDPDAVVSVCESVEEILFALDDEDIQTDLESNAWQPEEHVRHDSFVGALPHERSLEDHVREEDEALAASVTRLEIVCEAFDSVDPSAHAAEVSLRKRVGALAMLSNALRATCGFVLSAEHRELFAPGGLVEPYLASVHMWTADVTETLTELARELNALSPDWSKLRDRLAAAEWVFARAESEGERLDRVQDTLPDDLRAAIAELFAAIAVFKRDLAEPFG